MPWQTDFSQFFTGGPFPMSYVIMFIIGAIFVYLGIAKKWEPLLLVPIGFAMLVVNLFPALMNANMNIEAPINGTVAYVYVIPAGETVEIGKDTVLFQIDPDDDLLPPFEPVTAPTDGELSADDILVSLHDTVYAHDKLATLQNVSMFAAGATPTGLLSRIFRYGIMWEIIPPLIFLGLGALTDFGPLIADPKKFILGAAAQFGVFFVFFIALFIGFSISESCCIGIIGGADGPTTVFLTNKLSPALLCATAPAAYTYMAMVPLIQPPVIRALTTKEERAIYMKPQLREVSRLERLLFPFIIVTVATLLVPEAAPLMGCFMLGNLLLVSGVTERLSKTSSESFMDILTILLGLSIGGIMTAGNFLGSAKAVEIFGFGIVAFAVATAFGVLVAKLMNRFLKTKINPMIGAAGVSAVPMSARVVQRMGQEANPRNFLLMHAMGPNVAGVIGTITVAGIFLSMVG
jgi:oxaloacetate decarboxylase beta subunit